MKLTSSESKSLMEVLRRTFSPSEIVDLQFAISARMVAIRRDLDDAFLNTEECDECHKDLARLQLLLDKLCR
jgi:hypothetical protein